MAAKQTQGRATLTRLSTNRCGYNFADAVEQDLRVARFLQLEEHFSTPMQIENTSPTEFRKLFLASHGEYLGRSILDGLADLDESRLRLMLHRR
jgi:hypothetical protein